MPQHLNDILPAQLADSARVWIYQSDRPFTEAETGAVMQLLQDFVQGWRTHGAPVKGFGTVLYHQFIVLLADESEHTVGGCSTDSSVRAVKAIAQQLGVDLFNRQVLAFLIDDQVQLVPLQQLNVAMEQGTIGPDTLYFNNTVLTKKEMLDNWLVAAKDSWLGRKMGVESYGL
jgi:hypothetical protein